MINTYQVTYYEHNTFITSMLYFNMCVDRSYTATILYLVSIPTSWHGCSHRNHSQSYNPDRYWTQDILPCMDFNQ